MNLCGQERLRVMLEIPRDMCQAVPPAFILQNSHPIIEEGDVIY